MAINWLMVIAPPNTYYEYEAEERANQVLADFAAKERYDKQVWRINNLLKAALNEKKSKPGDAPRNQGQIRAIGEAVHEETLRRLKGNFQGRLDAIDGLLAQAEKTRKDREEWFDMVINSKLRKQLDILEKMVA